MLLNQEEVSIANWTCLVSAEKSRPLSHCEVSTVQRICSVSAGKSIPLNKTEVLAAVSNCLARAVVSMPFSQSDVSLLGERREVNAVKPIRSVNDLMNPFRPTV